VLYAAGLRASEIIGQVGRC